MFNKRAVSTEALTDSSYYILLSLLEPRHGYALMKYIEELTDGHFTIGPATMYTLIKKLQDQHLIELYEDNHERRKTYVVTEEGRCSLENDLKRRLEMVQQGQHVIQLAEGKDRDGS